MLTKIILKHCFIHLFGSDLLAVKAVMGEIVMSNDVVVNKSRRNLLIGATTLVGAVGAIGVAVPFVGSWNPSAKLKQLVRQ